MTEPVELYYQVERVYDIQVALHAFITPEEAVVRENQIQEMVSRASDMIDVGKDYGEIYCVKVTEDVKDTFGNDDVVRGWAIMEGEEFRTSASFDGGQPEVIFRIEYEGEETNRTTEEV